MIIGTLEAMDDDANKHMKDNIILDEDGHTMWIIWGQGERK